MPKIKSPQVVEQSSLRGKQPKNWRIETLESLFKIKHGYAFKGKYFSDAGKYIVLTPGNFTEKNGLVFREEKEKYYKGDFPKGYILKKDDLLVVMTDLKQSAPYLGAPGIIPQNDKCLHNQRLGLIQNINKKLVNKKFLYWLFESEGYREQVRGSATGATVKHTSPSKIYEIEVLIPTLPEQQKIADILSTYDNLIENNTKRIKILEEMAQAIYKEWFIYFRFHGHEKIKMVDSKTEFGEIPEEWEVRKVGNLGKIITGKTPPKKDSNNFGVAIPFIKTPDLHNKIFCIETGESLSVKGADTQKNKMLLVNALIVSCIGTLGVVGITSKESQTNQQINAVALDDRRYLEYGYFLLLDLKQTLRNIGANGATMGNVNKTKFENIEVIFPKEELVFAYHKKVKEMFDEILNLQTQNLNLRQARDLLLPKLISGEIEIK